MDAGESQKANAEISRNAYLRYDLQCSISFCIRFLIIMINDYVGCILGECLVKKWVNLQRLQDLSTWYAQFKTSLCHGSFHSLR